MKKVRFLFVVFIGIGIYLTMSSWGFLGHRTSHQLAIYELPDELRLFYYSEINDLVKFSTRPDERRNQDSTEAPKHFIDLEAYGENAAFTLAHSWNKALQQFPADTFYKYGYVPYEIIRLKDLLTNAFKNKDVDSILFYSEDLGHYIADANVPLHTSLNYDGQLTNQVGLHSLWETMIPEIEIEKYNLYSSHKATYLSKPSEEVWKAIQRAHTLLPLVFEKEKEVTKQFTAEEKYRVQTRRGKEVKNYTSGFAKAYAKSLGGTVNQQLIHSANLLADMWFTCWVDAGKPEMNSLIKKGNKESLEKNILIEINSFEKNELIKDNLLIAKKVAPEKVN